MWSTQFDIIVETLTGSEFEVTVTDKDTIGFIKTQIQKHEGIPVAQQNLIFNNRELSDEMEMKDIPLTNGSRLKFVLGMKGGPVSARRVVNMPDYDSWLDLNDILNSSRADQWSNPSVRLMVYKNYKKNIHRAMKCRTERKKFMIAEKETDADVNHQDDHWLKDNQHTMQKMLQIRSKLESKKNRRNPMIHEETKTGTKPKATLVGAIGERYTQKQRHDDEDKVAAAAAAHQLFAEYLTEDDCKTCGRSTPGSELHNHHFHAADLHEGRSMFNKHGLTKTCMRQQSLPQINQSGTAGECSGRTAQTKHSAGNDYSSIDFHDYFNVNSEIDLANNFNHYTENRLKVRDNIRRNRSFKTISNHDLLVEESQPTYNSRRLFGRPQTTMDHILMHQDRHYESTHLGTQSTESLAKFGGGDAASCHPTKLNNACDLVSRRPSKSAVNYNHVYENNFDFGLGNNGSSSSFTDFALGVDKVGTGSDVSNYRLYNMASEAKHQYELPKLLIREDSPVDTINSSDPQLETIVCGASGIGGSEQSDIGLDKLPKLDHHHLHLRHPGPSRHIHNDLFAASSTQGSTDQSVRSPWSHHHSDLGLNNIDVNSFSDNDHSTSSEHVGIIGSTNHMLFPTNIAESLNNWKHGVVPHSAGSLNTKSSGELSANIDKCDVFMGGGAKAKHPVDLKEFRMKFGSSPTLLSIPRHNAKQQQPQQSSRLDAVPFQYRRGYTNLNDACLSSSTSDLMGGFNETYNRGSNPNPKHFNRHQQPNHHQQPHGCGNNISGGADGTLLTGHTNCGNPDLTSMLLHRKNNSLDHVRSYEHLDSNSSMVSSIDEQGTDDGSCVNGGVTKDVCYSHFEHNRLHGDDDFLEAPGSFDFNLDSFSNTAASGYQSNESLFNVNFDSFEDSILDIDKLTLFEPLSPCTALTPPLPAVLPNGGPMQCSTANRFNDSRLLLYETMLDSIDAELQQTRDKTPPTILANQRAPSGGTAPEPIAEAAASVAAPVDAPKAPAKLRCAQCNKKLGVIMVMRCHCEKVFCAKHRYAEAHQCSYDFKQHGKAELERDNPLIVANKLPKI